MKNKTFALLGSVSMAILLSGTLSAASTITGNSATLGDITTTGDLTPLYMTTGAVINNESGFSTMFWELEGSATPIAFTTTASTSSSISTAGFGNTSVADSYGGIQYQATADGPITLTVPYTFSVSQAETGSAGAAYAELRAWSMLAFSTNNGDSYSQVDADPFTTGLQAMMEENVSRLLGVDETWSLLPTSGSLTFDYEANAGDILWFQYGVGTRSATLERVSLPVPVPGAILLLGSGIVGLLSIRRKN